ncbi:MAG: hypothetical protein HZC14_00160 [Candidatus Niyogibacteria bacterium]|nr:hypothetical protein [Candidatus Niyogibacteria bacterium]
MDISQAKKIMGKNFIGPDELQGIASKLGIVDPISFRKGKFPKIFFSEEYLKKNKRNYILILGIPKTKDGAHLTINKMRSDLGMDPNVSEPCFYNQDWYIREKFADKTHLKFKWYLICKNVMRQTRGISPENVEKLLARNQNLPSAILTAFTFFAYYFLTDDEILWKNDFIWCSDRDKNGDKVYTGRYVDPKKINKNGFNIHRHLFIRSWHGVAPQIV